MKPTIGGGWGLVTPQKMIHSSTIKQTGKIPCDPPSPWMKQRIVETLCRWLESVAGVSCHVFDKSSPPQHQIPQYQ